jgi:tripeptide aminopeptidase
MDNVTSRLLKYVKVNTISDPKSETLPSTQIQFDLAKILVEDLTEIGVKDASLDENCYVMGSIPGNAKNAPAIGLIAHMDTSPEFSGENVKPQIIEDYDGSDIVLNKDLNIVMKVSDFPYLADFKGHTLITTDGTTLLGADNKAGIAEIMEVAKYFIDNPDVKHGDIKICFTPDEEVGRGTEKFDLEKFGADFAYTLDGSFEGEIEYENFNAASAVVKIHGTNIHPGSAKHKMKNSLLIAMEFNALLPVFDVPQYTEGYEGFYHLDEAGGTVELTTLEYIIRDHDTEKFTARKEFMTKAAAFINEKYGEGTAEIEIKDSYFNMREHILPVMHIVDSAVAAMEKTGVKPIVKAIRGGTDGAALSYKGLPTPNIFTGGFNYHGRYEAVSVQSMNKAIATVIEILKSYAQ